MQKNEPIKGSTPMLVLRLLSQRPMHGYEIIKTIEVASSGVFTLNEGTLYPILHSLEREGLVTAHWEGDTNRKRKVYALTPQGGKALREKQQEWERARNAVDAVMGGESHAY